MISSASTSRAGCCHFVPFAFQQEFSYGQRNCGFASPLWVGATRRNRSSQFQTGVIRLGRYVRFRRSEIERFLENRIGACQ